jgi:hypothetical protein
MAYLNSTAISRAEYDSCARTLSIWFRESGESYDYFDVPEAIFQALLAAESAGQYFNDHIRNCYRSRRIT